MEAKLERQERAAEAAMANADASGAAALAHAAELQAKLQEFEAGAEARCLQLIFIFTAIHIKI